MSIFDIFNKKRKISPDSDYETSEYDGRLFFRTDDFCVEIRNIKLTTPPENWGEKEYGIISFTFDVLNGKEFIDNTDMESFNLTLGKWIQDELTTTGD